MPAVWYPARLPAAPAGANLPIRAHEPDLHSHAVVIAHSTMRTAEARSRLRTAHAYLEVAALVLDELDRDEYLNVGQRAGQPRLVRVGSTDRRRSPPPGLVRQPIPRPRQHRRPNPAGNGMAYAVAGFQSL